MILAIILAIENEDDRNLMLRIYTAYYPLMKSKAYNIVHDFIVADDIVQDAVVKLIDRLPTIRKLGKQQIVAYVCRTVNSVAIDYHRKNSKGENKESLSLTGYDEFEDNSQSPPEIYERLEEYEKLGKALSKLSDRDKDLLYYKYYINLSDMEIAHLLGLEHTNVRVSLSRARNRARVIISKMGGAE